MFENLNRNKAPIRDFLQYKNNLGSFSWLLEKEQWLRKDQSSHCFHWPRGFKSVPTMRDIVRVVWLSIDNQDLLPLSCHSVKPSDPYRSQTLTNQHYPPLHDERNQKLQEQYFQHKTMLAPTQGIVHWSLADGLNLAFSLPAWLGWLIDHPPSLTRIISYIVQNIVLKVNVDGLSCAFLQNVLGCSWLQVAKVRMGIIRQRGSLLML